MSARTRLVWRAEEIKRTAACLAAFAVIASSSVATVFGFPYLLGTIFG